ncbi:protein fem-1 homolog B-like [Clavelina lepadiformis]|uniref:protein fem-1 homolog B-like n=1 Tax=Clavelina lepadiformis TaxID=159417 RepID=UPI004041DFEB
MDHNKTYELILDSCHNGSPLTVAACLIDAGDKKDALLCKRHITGEGEVYTPFLIAVRNGHTQLVRLLLEQFQINQSQHTGTLNFDGYLIEAASPLWCASANGYLEIVKLLVTHGADLNKTTTTNSTPLRAACFHGKLSIVMYLMEHGADPNISNRYSNTCLMVSCYRGNLEVVEFLLHSGVDCNVQANCGGTALHLACESGHLLIVKSLVEGGCDINIKNKAGMTAAMVAADACKSEIVEYFTKQPNIDKQTKINLLELLGASYANDKDRYNTDKTYHYLLLAMLMRAREKLEKEIQPAVEAYNNRLECQTPQELQDIHHDQDAIHVEALIVRERILGLKSLEIIHPIVYRGAVYADGLQFNRCIKLWKRALHLRQLNKRSAHNDLLRFAEVFSQMILLSEKIVMSDLCDITNSCVKEIIRSKNEVEKHQAAVIGRLSPEGVQMDVESNSEINDLHQDLEGHTSLTAIQANIASAMKVLDTNLHTLLYLIFIFCRIEKHSCDKHKFGSIIYRFLKMDVRSTNNSTLLHMAVNEKTPVDDFHVKDVVSFPDCDVTKFLLSCGAKSNVQTVDGDTPLHIIVQYEKPISDFITLHQIITQLLDHGAHFDACNAQRKCPLELSTTGVAEIILKTQAHLTLKCLAAKVIRQNNIKYEGLVPKYLKELVDMH